MPVSHRSEDSFVNDGPLSYETCSSQEKETPPASQVSPCGEGGGEDGDGRKKRKRGRPRFDDDGDEKVCRNERDCGERLDWVALDCVGLCGEKWVGFCVVLRYVGLCCVVFQIVLGCVGTGLFRCLVVRMYELRYVATGNVLTAVVYKFLGALFVFVVMTVRVFYWFACLSAFMKTLLFFWFDRVLVRLFHCFFACFVCITCLVCLV